MKRTAIILAILFSTLTVSMLAATPEEWEKARTQAAKLYVRYSDNGSGYLDGKNFDNLAALENAVKVHPKDLELFNKFKQSTGATDYSSWDSAKVIAYFTEDIYKNSSLATPAQGAGEMKSKLRNSLGKMTFTAGAPAQPQEPSPEPAEEPAQPQTLDSQEPVSVAGSDDGVMVEDLSAAADSTATVPTPAPSKKGSNMWVYIVLLVVIVGVAAWLVYYASKVMKAQGSNKAPISTGTSDDDRREMQALRNENDRLEKENDRLEQDNSRLNRECESLRSQVVTLQKELRDAGERTETSHQATQPISRADAPLKSNEKVVWLGRVNADGIFVRADKQYNPEGTIYKMVTSDGYSGSFYFADKADADRLALENPRRMLAGGCLGADFDNPGDATRIVTVSAGTAVFESGCWKVIRKAKIRFE